MKSLELRDGLYRFRRDNADATKMCIYELYCTNLNYKAMTNNELYGLVEENEILFSKWLVYNLSSLKHDEELKPALSLIIEPKVVYIIKDQHDIKKKLLWEMNQFHDEIVIYEEGRKEKLLYTCKKYLQGHSNYEFIDHE